MIENPSHSLECLHKPGMVIVWHQSLLLNEKKESTFRESCDGFIVETDGLQILAPHTHAPLTMLLLWQRYHWILLILCISSLIMDSGKERGMGGFL